MKSDWIVARTWANVGYPTTLSQLQNPVAKFADVKPALNSTSAFQQHSDQNLSSLTH
jgi:hypothetical protein